MQNRRSFPPLPLTFINSAPKDPQRKTLEFVEVKQETISAAAREASPVTPTGAPAHLSLSGCCSSRQGNLTDFSEHLRTVCSSSNDSKRETFEKGTCVGVGFRSGVACLLICASGEEGERAGLALGGPHPPLASLCYQPPVEDKMVWRVDVLVLLLGLVISAAAGENLKKFPILMPHVKPERVSAVGRMSGGRDN